LNLSSSITSRLQFQHRTIEELIKEYNEDSLRIHTIPGKWSAFENIVHLVTYQFIFQERIEKIIAGNNPAFPRYVAENDPVFYEWLQHSLPQLLQSLHSVRKQINQQLIELTTDQLAYIGQHPLYGALSLVQWAEFFLLHEAHHLFTLFKLLNEARKTPSN
jgi:hypothetical protein